MDCSSCQRYVTAYVDHELGLEQMLLVEEHVAACSACRERLENERETALLVAEYFPRLVAPERLLHRIRAALRSPVRWPMRSTSVWPLAAALFLVWLGWWIGIGGGLSESPPEIVRDAIALHRHAGLPDASAVRTHDPALANRWLRERLAFIPEGALRTPDGAELVAAQVVNIAGTSAGFVRYRARDGHVSLFLLPARSLPASGEKFWVRGVEFRAYAWQGERPILWNHDSVCYILVAESNREIGDHARDRSPRACGVCHAVGNEWARKLSSGELL